jgi:hypothetical protein
MLKRILFFSALVWLNSLTASIGSQQPAPAEKIRDISPDQKFAMRIQHDAELNRQLIEGEKAEKEEIFSEAIQAIELVSLPSKNVAAQLIPPEPFKSNHVGEIYWHFTGITLLWSSDSNWCAFHYAEPRTGYTTVFRRNGKRFDAMNQPEKLIVRVKGDVRNQYVEPVRWLGPGVLMVDQLTILRNNGGDFHYTYKVRFKARNKFEITSRKSLPPY